MITSATQVQRVIGARGINPQGRLNVDFELIDRLDGQGVQIRVWNQLALGAPPTELELALANSPRLSLSQEINGTDDGVLVTCQLDDTTNSVINWRCIDPDGESTTVNGPADNGQDVWEILTGKPGIYTVSAWSNSYGYAEISFEGV